MTEELNRGCLDEREAFEAWMPTSWSRESYTDSEGETIYCDDLVQGAWIGFTAGRASLSTSKQAGAEPVNGVTRGISVSELADWVAERWHAEVKNRPMINIHRRALDDTWRQVLRHLEIDDRARLGPTHDELRAAISSKEWEAMNGRTSS